MREREICPHPPRPARAEGSAPGARELLGGEEHRAAGRKLRPPLKGEIRLAAAMRDEAAEVRDRGAGRNDLVRSRARSDGWELQATWAHWLGFFWCTNRIKRLYVYLNTN